ncbi:MAG: S8 family serine peptidase, partial [Nocardioides sp.]
MTRPGGRHGWRRGAAPVALGAALTLSAGALLSPVTAAETDDAPTVLHLVTFDGAGTAGYRGPLTAAWYRTVLTGQQDATLATVGAAAPVYRWTTALSGVALELTPEQAEDLRNAPHVEAVEENTVRTLAATSAPATASVATGGRGGQGVVVGVVDTGIWPDSPLFADSPGLGSAPPVGPAGFSGRCQSGEDWSRGVCNDKLVGASWFVTGFGVDRLASDEPLSPRDVRGHGTQMASIAAGNAEVSVEAPGLRDTFTGVAPRARLAVYKACWSAPDPRDDGCSTADLVAAIDRATRDGVDVLNLSVSGGAGIDTVERALLGAAEAGIVVVAAAGNAGTGDYASHVSPWVTTVGGLTTTDHTGAVDFGGRTVAGTMTARRSVSSRIVLGRAIPAPGNTRLDAELCTPGSLDASAAINRIVVCGRGTLGRVEKSAAVERAGGVGMVLVDTGPGSPAHDLHAVPTVHLDESAGERLTRWAARHPQTRVTLRPTSHPAGPSARVAPWSPDGDPGGSFVKPDLVAPATGVLAGTAPAPTGSRWTFASGTSAATAWTSGAAAVLLARHDWTAPVVRSALATSSDPAGGPLRAGAGALR